MGSLNLPDGARVRCWDLTVARLQADANLNGALTVEVFDGAGSVRDLQDLQGPAVRFTPQPGRSALADEARFGDQLLAGVEAVLWVLDPRDVLNLSDAIRAALYPGGGSGFVLSLQTAGASTGEWTWATPLASPQWAKAGQNHIFRVTGVLSLDVVSDPLATGD